MAEWLVEDGIGERRAALVENGVILAARIVWDDDPAPPAGLVAPARLAAIHVPGRRGLVRLEGGAEALLEPIPPGVPEGAMLTVEIVRASIPENGRMRPARARATDRPPAPVPDLAASLAATGRPVRLLLPHEPDLLEAAGWSELVEQAVGGDIAFPGGTLRLSPTPAMTLFDVDGSLPPAALAIAGARAAAEAVLRLDIGGSIGIDLPTLPDKAARAAAAAAVDAILPQPFERTAVNGFGFLQIVRRRERASIPERLRAAPVAAAARALLRRAERAGGRGGRALVANPAVIAALRKDWIAALSRRLGATVVLKADPVRAISAGDVVPEFP